MRRPVSIAPISASKLLRWSALGAGHRVVEKTRLGGLDLDVGRGVPIEDLAEAIVRVDNVPVETGST